jgi:hypothetical protein|eukprot:855823_1
MGCTALFPKTKLYAGQDSRQKFVSYRDHGLPKNVHDDQIQLLAGHISKIIRLIDDQKWDEANEALGRKEIAKSLGFRIDSPFLVCNNDIDAISFCRRKAMWMQHNKKMTLPQVVIASKGTPDSEWMYPEDMPQLAMRIFPIWLEEWIHVFQGLIAGPVCDETIAFRNSRYFENDWDVNEVDIYAIYRDLGWDQEMLHEMESRYDERIAFASHDVRASRCDKI